MAINCSIKSVNEKQNIFILDLELPEKLISECIDVARNTGDVQNKNTNVKAAMTYWTTSYKHRSFEKLKCHLVYVMEKLLEGTLKNSFSNGSASLFCYNDWVAMYKKDDYTKPHAHSPAHISFVYYLKAQETDPGLTFPDHDITIPVKTGRFIIFPGSLVHEVKKTDDDIDRIVYAGNCNVR